MPSIRSLNRHFDSLVKFNLYALFCSNLQVNWRVTFLSIPYLLYISFFSSGFSGYVYATELCSRVFWGSYDFLPVVYSPDLESHDILRVQWLISNDSQSREAVKRGHESRGTQNLEWYSWRRPVVTYLTVTTYRSSNVDRSALFWTPNISYSPSYYNAFPLYCSMQTCC
jgi:hypothetical protein